MKIAFQKCLAVFQKKILLYLLYLWVVILFGVIFAYFGVSSGKVITGLKVADIKIGELPIAEASRVLAQKLNLRLDNKITLVYNNRTISVIPSAIGIGIDIQATINRAYRTGRAGSLWTRLTTRWRGYQRSIDIQPVFNYNRNTLESFYRLLDVIIAIEPIRSVITVNRQGEITYTPSRTCRAVDHQQLAALLEKAVSASKTYQIEIPVLNVVPPLTETDINSVESGSSYGDL